MTVRSDLLIEIGTEELPPKALRKLSEALAEGIKQGLTQAGLEPGALHAYATPRRLAVKVEQLLTFQPDRVVERRGPALNAAFDAEGNPTKAALGFAQSCGISIDQAEKLEADKGAWLVYRSTQRGAPAPALIPALLTQALAALPTPKRMRWGSLREEFVRPVHWLVLLLGDKVIECEILGVQAGRQTRGHRFHRPQVLYLSEPAAYAPLLETEGRVIASFADRREAIRAQVIEAAVSVRGQAVIDEALLDEVTAMVEWPVAMLGAFEEKYLELPPEVLIATMKANQKYFHVIDDQGKLQANFITVCNIESRDSAQVRAGNERVIRPRLSDAAFFWTQDRKSTLADRVELLKSVIFQEKLGTLYDKTQRVAELVAHMAQQTGGQVEHARRAALLSKCDLLTHMVGEFPEVQGIMGRYYAQAEGEPHEVAAALDEQYLPRYAGDSIPQTNSGRCLAIADKLDTLVGIFAIGQAPTGDKDPFALRRAALGALRILIEAELNLDLEQLLRGAAQRFPDQINTHHVVEAVYDFMMERLRAYYVDAGLRRDVIEAVLAQRPTRPHDFDRRVRAVSVFRAMPEAESLAAASKRIRNILKQAKEPVPQNIDPGKLVEPAERVLAERVQALAQEVTPLFDAGDYTAALKRLAGLREPVDVFFDKVMVMADDAALRINRLALLNNMNNLFMRAADLSRLQ